MKTGLVGFQGGGKSTVFELLTGVAPDPAKAHTGQVGQATVADPRFDQLLEHYRPGKEVPARIELLDTPGLDRKRQLVASRIARHHKIGSALYLHWPAASS